MATRIADAGLPWVEITNLESEAAGAGDVKLDLCLEGPAIDGRAVQPYEGGLFRVTAVFSLTDFPTRPPTFQFTTRVWHPLVVFETQAMCREAIPELWDKEGYKKSQEALAALSAEEREREPMLSALVLLRDLLARVHERSDMTAVNSDAMQMLKGDGAAFDRKAKEVTDRYARE